MSSKLTIGKVSKRIGVPAKTIRFYEDEGLIPAPSRTESGYRLYNESDLLRLQLIRRARLLGLDLPSIKALLDTALSADCATFGDDLNQLLDRRRKDVDQRIAELTALREELDELQAHVTHCCEGCDPGVMAADCSFCCLLTEEKGG